MPFSRPKEGNLIKTSHWIVYVLIKTRQYTAEMFSFHHGSCEFPHTHTSELKQIPTIPIKTRHDFSNTISASINILNGLS